MKRFVVPMRESVTVRRFVLATMVISFVLAVTVHSLSFMHFVPIPALVVYNCVLPVSEKRGWARAAELDLGTRIETVVLVVLSLAALWSAISRR